MEILYLEPNWLRGGDISFRCPDCYKRIKVNHVTHHIRGNYATLTITPTIYPNCRCSVFNVHDGIIKPVPSL